jgi:chaperonin GroEL
MNIPKSNVYTENEAREALMRGVSAVASAVKGTLGAAGHNAILERSVNPGHIVTNDGVSIAHDVKMEDPVENIGANLAKEISQRSDKESGDGTTTSIVLLEAILKEGIKAEGSPMEIKRSLDECLPIILKSIDEQKKEISVDEVASVAAVSAESDVLGNLLQQIYQEIGKDGIVELDNSNTFDTFYEIKEGVRLRNSGYIAPYMANEGTRAIYKKPRILIAKAKIGTLTDVDGLFQALNGEGVNEIVIFCDEIDPTVLSALAFTHQRGIFKTLIIKAPTLWKDWIFEDFSKITGANIVDGLTTTWKSVTTKDLGTCDKLITSKEETSVIGIKDVSEHIKNLEELGKQDDQQLIRASWLQTKAAVLKLGANSESELSYIRLKAEDARNACHLALKDGVVPGGGVALWNASIHLPDSVGGDILRDALKRPLWQIINNTGDDKDVIYFPSSSHGYDANTGEIVDMWEAGILDPALVVKNAIKNAISVAGTVLTSRVIIINKQEKTNETTQSMRGM